jgi:hypothetical protein
LRSSHLLARGYVATKDADGACRAGVVDLATLDVQPMASVAVPGPAFLYARETRWLACNAVEMLVTGLMKDDAGAPAAMRVYWMRLAADAAK